MSSHRCVRKKKRHEMTSEFNESIPTRNKCTNRKPVLLTEYLLCIINKKLWSKYKAVRDETIQVHV